MDQLTPGKNTGVIEVAPTMTDWKVGAETGILAIPVNPTGDWRSFLPTDEKQLIIVDGVSYGDTEACTDFSSTNVCEIELNYMIAKGTIPSDALSFLQTNGYIDANGKVNFSDRFDAVMAKTDPHVGNSLPNVWQSKKDNGLIPESDWPMPVDEIRAYQQSTPGWNIEGIWKIYYKAIPANLITKGLEFKKHFGIQYEWVVYPGSGATPATMSQYLTVAPLQLATAVCSGWNTENPINACGPGTQHATTMTYIEPGVAFDIYDHYNPFQKRFAIDYTITYAMRGLVVPLAITPVVFPAPNPFSHKFTTQLDLGQTNPEVVAVQDALKIDGEFSTSVQSTGYFGMVTMNAIEKFQVKYGIAAPGIPGYGRVGPKTLVKLNQLFNK